jgi:hypothetical protein
VEHLDEIARILNRAGVSAAPIPSLNALSIFTVDEHENFDLDVIGPRQRRAAAAALTAAGFAHRSGREFRRGNEILRFPRPKRTLGTDPAIEAREVVQERGVIALLTPTQAALLMLYEETVGGGGGTALKNDGLAEQLAALAHEQPMNMGKMRQWARPAGLGERLEAMRSAIEASQRRGIEDRRQRRFKTRLPH